MKIGQVVTQINQILSDESDDYKHKQYINATKINAFRKMDLIKPPLEKKVDSSYYVFYESHINLITIAYRKMIFQRMRTRDAFELAYIEISSPTLF